MTNHSNTVPKIEYTAISLKDCDTSLLDFKNALGGLALNLSDDEIQDILYRCERFSDVVIDMVIEKQNKWYN